MSRTAQSADGKIHEFPDETPDDVIDAAMKNYVSGSTAPSTPKTKSEASAQSLKNIPMGPYNDPRGAILTAGSGIAGTIAGGYAGMAGTVVGQLKGDRYPMDRGKQWLENTRNAITIAPPNQASERVLQGLGSATTAPGSVAVSAFENVGVSSPEDDESRLGMQQARPDAEAIRNTYQQSQEEGPSRYIGNKVLDATGSPMAAMAAEITPAAVGGAWSLDRPRVPDVPTVKPLPVKPTVANQPGVSVGKPSMDTPVDFTPVSSESVVQSLRKGKVEQVVDAVYPDLEVIKSAQDLGVVLNPEHYSTNTGFQDVARALKTRPGSELQIVENAAFAKLDIESKKLVTELDGRIDRGEFSDDVYMDTRAKIDSLSDRADAAYKQVRETIPNETPVDPTSIDKFLKQRLEDLGGRVDMLNPIEAKLYKLIHRKVEVDGQIVTQVTPPTYMALDRIRGQIGDGFKRRGEFAELDDLVLAEGYGLLSDVQGGVARAFGVGDLYVSGRGLVQTRKNLEKTAVAMFGKDMAGSLVPKIRAAANNLVGGDVAHFKKLMNALPKSRRAQAAANVLGEILAGGTKKGAEVGSGLAASWRALNNNKTAKDLLFSYLTKDARKRFDDIGRVTNGIVQSTRKSLSNPSGSAGPIIQALNDLSAVEKIFEGGKKVIAAEGVSSTLGMPGVGAAGVIGGLLSKTRTPMVVSAENLLISPKFTQAMNKAIEGDISSANQIIENSAEFNAWKSNLSKQDALNLSKVGFIAWLTEDQK